ncbi:alanine racemase [Candidatus Gracilibacteria bacterium]|nr:alanine racemase [Candidatus Gracilibacteria bacterium]
MNTSENLKKNLRKILIEDEVEAISVVNPEQFEKNIENFEKILEENRLKYAIHAVLKVNHSNELLRVAKAKNLRADVSSIGELDQALAMGFDGTNITSNGPKNRKFLNKSIEIGATIAVDSIEELEKITEIAREKNTKIAVILRLGAFKNASDTRFGIAKWLWNLAINILEKNRENLEVLGYHFHIDIPDVNTRIDVFWESIEFYKKLLTIGFAPKIIDIGGSYGTFYQNDSIQSFGNAGVAHHKMYQNHEYSGENFLQHFLTKTIKGKPAIKDFIRENNITLWLEPGRSLYGNNVGFVATTVLGTREDSLILNTHSFALGMREEELPTNPILVDDADGEKNNFYYFLGNLCLESDMIYSRNIGFARKVQDNDIIIFPNMAAYHMDFYETESIAHPKKVKFFEDENGDLVRDL